MDAHIVGDSLVLGGLLNNGGLGLKGDGRGRGRHIDCRGKGRKEGKGGARGGGLMGSRWNGPARVFEPPKSERPDARPGRQGRVQAA